MSVKKLKTGLVKNKIKGLALDIDDTLSFTWSYWAQSLQEKFGGPKDLSLTEIRTKYQLVQNVPHWQSREAYEWMEMARKSNEIQELLPLIENSNKMVERIDKIIPVVCYLTIRGQSVIPGTEKWLRKHGFPKAPVIAKPDDLPLEEGSIWKAETLRFLYPHVLGIIDDNPALINYLDASYKGTIFLYNNLEIPQTPLKVIQCKNWEDIPEKVVNFLQT